MRNPIKYLSFILVSCILSCSSSFIVKTDKTTINLEPLSKNTIKVGIDTGKYISYFSRNDLVELFEKDQEKWFDQRIESYVEDLRSLNSDTIFKNDETVLTLEMAEYGLKFYDLLLAGKARIINKETQERLGQIECKLTRDKLGGENAYFYTQDGIKFYEIVLAFGE